ncbi:TetR/AcrR family transcriptional regulator [Amycolatopsis sp.]|uniref:TetR/AcrR family transcriptional regulator n=1 Tax=Amycolatopsis sp. TaxID=37632 RepID=UPI002620CA9E|nr:TetR/AcrR family transcriptional regulator [Amycolatopsis sp.]
MTKLSTGASVESTSKAARTRERILDATAEVLCRSGYAGTRLTDIAEVADLQAPAIYYHFPSREDVIEEVIRVGQRLTIDHVRTALDALPLETTAIDRILAAVTAHLEVVLTRSLYASASIRNMSQLPEDMRERQLELRREYGAMWRALFERAAELGELDPRLDPHAARMLVLGALNWAPEWWNPERGTTAEIVANAQHLVRFGLAVQRPARRRALPSTVVDRR